MIAKRRTLRGIAISSGIALGYTRIVHSDSLKVAEIPIKASQVKAELAALERAVEGTVEELKQLRESAGRKIGGAVAKIFDAQLLIANDQDFIGRVKDQISKLKRNAGFVYNTLVQETTLQLSGASAPYMRQMVQDVEAVAGRVLSRLGGNHPESPTPLRRDTIIVGGSLTPAEILRYRQRKAIGFVSGKGGPNSHMALIARSLMLPVTALEKTWSLVPDDSRIIVDGTKGLVIINPTDLEWTDYQKRKKKQGLSAVARIRKLCDIPPKTADGKEFPIAANLEFPGPIDDMLSDHKVPVGLYRTEFIYLEREKFPTEKEQYRYYLRIAERFSESSVVLRTFDLGSDKLMAVSGMPAEDNPALGWRGIRQMLEMPDVFKTQIRAMLRASVHKNLKILLPMITDLSELKKARRLISQVMFELKRDGIPFDDKTPIGIMVEVPSAALMAHQLVKEADFVSVGTNDLTQYALSVDRSNTRMAGLYSSFHPSVLQLIEMTIRACSKAGKDSFVCGEIAGDPLALPLLVGMGVTGLSMNPVRIPDICKLVERIDSQLVRHLVRTVLSSSSTAAVKRKLQSFRNALENR